MGFTDFIFAIFYLFIILALILGLIFSVYISYLELKDWQDTKRLIRENNGTCIDKGYSVECSYSDSYKVINSESKCYRNDVEINCSELG